MPAALLANVPGYSLAMPAPQAHSGGHGVAFRPGTSLVLKNIGYGTTANGYELVGYFVDK